MYSDGKKDNGNGNDFEKAHGVGEGNVIKHIRDVITYGEVEYSIIKEIGNGRMGYERLYKYKDKYYMMGAIGLNGFLVSTYPVSAKIAEKKIKRCKNGND